MSTTAGYSSTIAFLIRDSDLDALETIFDGIGRKIDDEISRRVQVFSSEFRGKFFDGDEAADLEKFVGETTAAELFVRSSILAHSLELTRANSGYKLDVVDGKGVDHRFSCFDEVRAFAEENLVQSLSASSVCRTFAHCKIEFGVAGPGRVKYVIGGNNEFVRQSNSNFANFVERVKDPRSQLIFSVPGFKGALVLFIFIGLAFVIGARFIFSTLSGLGFRYLRWA